nr:unnamed protein product [Digitaria exilis]
MRTKSKDGDAGNLPCSACRKLDAGPPRRQPLPSRPQVLHIVDRASPLQLSSLSSPLVPASPAPTPAACLLQPPSLVVLSTDADGLLPAAAEPASRSRR